MADCTQQYTDCGEIDDLYECAKLLIANSKLFRDWTNGDEDTTVLLGGKPFPSLRAIIQNVNRLANIATLETPGASMPDGTTITVDGLGKYSALGGNLLLNSEEIITESGTFEVSVTGWYEVLVIDGGQGGGADANSGAVRFIAHGGKSGRRKWHFIYLHAGDEVPVVIGTGGLASNGAGAGTDGGASSFGDLDAEGGIYYPGSETPRFYPVSPQPLAYGGANGGGPGGGLSSTGGYNINTITGYHYVSDCDGQWYGAGGAGFFSMNGFSCSGNGVAGAVLLRWHNPAKAAGPAPQPVPFAARRMAAHVAAAPATVNLYDPATGQGSVWREEDAEAKLAEGMISEEAWLAICAARAAEERAAWLADPETEAERFALLRAARDARLAATDYLVAPDYQLTDEQRTAVTAYRQALRDLPAEEGAPWDGGGEDTPWPAMPTLEKAE